MVLVYTENKGNYSDNLEGQEIQMNTGNLSRIYAGLAFITILFVSGCVERELTIVTKPEGAKVVLNDEEIGTSPVTVPFNWYGNYKVHLSKKGCETLITNRCLKRPAHDYFPLDLLADVLGSKRVDRYCWEFELSEYSKPDRNALIDRANQMKSEGESEIQKLSELSSDNCSK